MQGVGGGEREKERKRKRFCSAFWLRAGVHNTDQNQYKWANDFLVPKKRSKPSICLRKDECQ
jgi:hypothetical protein